MMLYFEWIPALSLLNNEERGNLLYTAMLYAKGGESPVVDARLQVLWESMKEAIDRDAQRYNDKCEQNRQNREKRSRNDEQNAG